MEYAIIQTGGKQYKAKIGDIIDVEKLEAASGDSFIFDKVLLYTADGVSKIGQPLLDGATVTGKILEQFRGEKIRVAKFKAKARYRRVTGHRQSLTKVQIEKIDVNISKDSGQIKNQKSKLPLGAQVKDTDKR